jgi:peptide/nickel transport system substrate-binding protein
MKTSKLLTLVTLLALFAMLAAACGPSTPEKVVETVEVTKEVLVEVTKEVPVEVTKEVPVEVTKEVVVKETVEVVVTATPAPPKPSGPRYGETLIIGHDIEPTGLDPHTSSSWHSQLVYENIYGNLVRFSLDGVMEPDLAVRWEHPDDLTYVFYLRQGVKWHNGSDFTAEDVKFSFERQMDPEVPAYTTYWKDILDKMEVIDPYTVKLTLKESSAPFMNYIGALRGGAIVSKEYVEGGGNLDTHPIGTGPFKFEEYVPADHLSMVKNPDYYEEGVPYLDGITLQYIPDESARLAAIRAGQVDLTWVANPILGASLAKEPGLQVIAGGYSKPLIMFLNCTTEPFDNKLARQALALSLNREELIDTICLGNGGLSTRIPPADKVWTFPDPAGLPLYRQDQTRARALLEEAGYTTEKPAEFTIETGTQEMESGLAEAIKSYAEQVGFKVNIELSPPGGVHFEHWTDLTYKGCAILGHVLMMDPDAYYRPDWYSTSEVSHIGYKNPEMDELLDKAIAETDLSERIKLYYDIQNMEAEEAAWIIPFAVRLRTEVAQTWVKGYQGMGKQNERRGLWYAWLEK